MATMTILNIIICVGTLFILFLIILTMNNLYNQLKMQATLYGEFFDFLALVDISKIKKKERDKN